ncbi:MAG: helix-turn-helix domain-containing protein [Proteobacteria bacterium]|nr:helix-turn-helix domain-containing protein [Pseudomonadota bacterium]
MRFRRHFLCCRFIYNAFINFSVARWHMNKT